MVFIHVSVNWIIKYCFVTHDWWNKILINYWHNLFYWPNLVITEPVLSLLTQSCPYWQSCYYWHGFVITDTVLFCIDPVLFYWPSVVLYWHSFILLTQSFFSLNQSFFLLTWILSFLDFFYHVLSVSSLFLSYHFYIS